MSAVDISKLDLNGIELSTEQRYALQQFQSGENVFVSGPGGSGKSHLIRYFLAELYRKGWIHQVCSTTGSSAILLSNQLRVGGKPVVVKTIHSWSGIRLGRGSLADIAKLVFKSRRVVKEWKRCRVLILDEVSMLSKKLFTVLEYLARYIRGNERPFGGMQVVCLGDFFQLSPVGDVDDPDSCDFAFESAAWSRVFALENHIELVRVYRQTDDVYKKILHEVRLGTLSPESTSILQGRVGIPYDAEKHHGVCPIRLFATRNQVQRLNMNQYLQLEGKVQEYTMEKFTDIRTYIENGDLFEDDVLERCRQMTEMEVENECKNMSNQLQAEETLSLKVGVPVMCLANLDVEAGVANGSMGVVESFATIEAPTYSGATTKRMITVPVVLFYNGLRMKIGPYTWQCGEFPCIVITQLPLSLAYATSIHKMQGATLDVAEMDLGTTIFAEHQTYVALSRLRSLDGVYLTSFHPHKIRVHPKVVRFYDMFATGEIEEEVGGEEEAAAVEEEGEVSAVVEEVVVAEEAVATVDTNTNNCPICLEFHMDKPYETTCKHRFCYDCITRLIQSTLTRCASCPLCRNPITTASLTMVPVLRTPGGNGRGNPAWKASAAKATQRQASMSGIQKLFVTKLNG